MLEGAANRNFNDSQSGRGFKPPAYSGQKVWNSRAEYVETLKDEARLSSKEANEDLSERVSGSERARQRKVIDVRRKSASKTDLLPQYKHQNSTRNVSSSQRFAANDPIYNDPTRNAEVQGRYQRQTTDQSFNDEYSKKGLQPTNLDRKKKKPNKTKQQRLAAAANAGGSQPRKGIMNKLAGTTPLGRVAIATAAIKGGLIAKARARAVTTTIWSWGTFLWLWVQLPLALLSLIALGISATIQSFCNRSGRDQPFDFKLRLHCCSAFPGITFIQRLASEVFPIEALRH